MATMTPPAEFIELLSLLNKHDVRYLLIGGYAVVYHGYPRNTGDIDFWVARNPDNAQRVVAALREFGLDVPDETADLLLGDRQILRTGVPPFRVEVTSGIAGVEFESCYQARVMDDFGGEPVAVNNLDDLKRNKAAAGRLKDLADLEHLP